jgi:hypothetical protein
MIRSSAKILKDAVGEIILNGKYAWNCYKFGTVSELQCSFYKIEIILFNIICQQSSLSAIKERNSESRSAFKSPHQSTTFLSTTFLIVLGTCHTYYRYYCPNLLTVLQLCVLPLIARNPLQTIKTNHNINVKTLSL